MPSAKHPVIFFPHVAIVDKPPECVPRSVMVAPELLGGLGSKARFGAHKTTNTQHCSVFFGSVTRIEAFCFGGLGSRSLISGFLATLDHTQATPRKPNGHPNVCVQHAFPYKARTNTPPCNPLDHFDPQKNFTQGAERFKTCWIEPQGVPCIRPWTSD